jgi:hypothetical protein
VTEGRAAGTHLSAAAIRSEGGPARRAFPTAEAQSAQVARRAPGRVAGRQAAARGLLPCNFSTLRPKSQETDGASAHPPTQTQVKEASTHSLTHSQLPRISQYLQIITIHHFTAQPSQTLIRRTRPSTTRRPSPSRATSAAVLALFSLLSPAAGSASMCTLGAHATTPGREPAAAVG